MEIKDKIRKRRLELKLTLEEVATAVGVAKSTVKKWESGQIASMRQSKIVALARILQVEPTYLVIKEETLNSNKASGRTAEFMELFELLTEEQQNLIISQIKGILSNQ